MTNPWIDNKGAKHWCDVDGEFHREDGPAWEWADGSKFWYIHGREHREDGPAREWADGTKEWWINKKLIK